MRMDNLDGLLQIGLLSGSASGKPLIDLFIFLCGSIAWTCLKAALSPLFEVGVWTDATFFGFSPWDAICVRSIKNVQRTSSGFGGYHGSDDSRVHNSVLQKAVLVYSNDRSPHLFGAMKRGNISLSETNRDMRVVGGDPDCAVSEGSEKIREVRTRIILSPAPNRWTTVQRGVWKNASYEISIKCECTSEDVAGGNVRETTENIRVMGRCSRDPAGLVESFVHKAYDHYRKALQDEVETTKRFVFSIRSSGSHRNASGDGRGFSEAVSFTKSVLAEDRGLDTVYHAMTDNVRRLLDDFATRKGKFAVYGHPYKIGFLLHGPPGCGKTSLIKAIASHTRRHIVSVSLDKIRNNSELEEVMTSERYVIGDRSGPVYIPNDKVVFVLEDVDAASDTVLVRRGLRSPQSERVCAVDALASAIGQAVGDLDESARCKSSHVVADCGPVARSWGRRLADEALTLSGLLNVLDGIQDSPGRIVVMTSNHPETLDPALTRPGRVTMNLRMGCLTPAHATLMANKYFPGADQRLLRAIAGIARASQLTPATLETLCGSSTCLETVLNSLEPIRSVEAVEAPEIRATDVYSFSKTPGLF